MFKLRSRAVLPDRRWCFVFSPPEMDGRGLVHTQRNWTLRALPKHAERNQREEQERESKTGEPVKACHAVRLICEKRRL